MDIKKLDTYNKSYLEGLERSSKYSYSAQYFWWKKYNVLEKTIKNILNNNFNKKSIINIIDIGCQVGHDIFKLSDKFSNYKIN